MAQEAESVLELPHRAARVAQFPESSFHTQVPGFAAVDSTLQLITALESVLGGL